MAIETLRPNAAGDECNIRNQTGAACPDHYQNVDEAVSDGHTTKVVEWQSPYTTWYRDLYNIEDSGAGTGDINKVTVYARCVHMGGTPNQASLKIAIKTGGTAFEGSEETLTGSWVNYSKEWATNPDTGLAWTWAEINSLQAGLAMRNINTADGAGSSSNCTQVWVEVDYNPAKSSSDSGSGLEGAPVPTATLASSESGLGLGAISSQLAAITSVDTGTSVELSALLKDLFASELGRGADSFTAKIESPTRGGGMKLWT